MLPVPPHHPCQLAAVLPLCLNPLLLAPLYAPAANMTPRPRIPLAVRAAAIKAYYQAGGCMRTAVRLFEEEHPLHTVANPHDFIKYWVAVFDQRFSVLDAPAHGPTPAINDALAEECIVLLLSGYSTEGGQRRYYCSIAEAVHKCGRLREIMDDAGVKTPAALLRRLRRKQPTLTRRHQRYCYQYSPTNKQERFQHCQMMLWLPAVTMMQLLCQAI